ncbi:MAG: precorrin-2 C(20)-methyltransferase [Gemmatimonadaceae bacterium]|nr:precorrin-2 C(20)-methyltransferase [Gloeobacterales cyanobacterium ES-bin-141]
MSTGKLYGIGVGPGDPELLTLKGLRILQSVPVVACPQDRRGEAGWASRIVAQYLVSTQKLRALHMPFVPEREQLEPAWAAAADLLYEDLSAGLDVAFITEGDASFYSTFTYLLGEFQTRYPHIAIEVVPGVCSPLAAAAALHMPLVIGSEVLTVMPAMHRLADLEQALLHADTVVLLKVTGVYEPVYRWLEEREWLGQAFLVEWVSGANQQVHRCLPPPGEKLPYFSLLVIRRSAHLTG